jgi:O-antigen/teichoic acid export membrane protein
MQGQSNRKNSLWLAIQFSLIIIFSLITLKLNLVHYGKELFGSWILVASMWGIGRVLDFGLGTSLIKFVAEYNNNNSVRLNVLFSSCFFLIIILGILIFVIIYGITQYLYFGTNSIIPVNHSREIWNVFIILGLWFYINYITIFFKSVFEGMNEFVISSKISIVNSILILISVAISFYFDLPLVYLAFGYLFSSLMILLIYITVFRIKCSNHKISWKLIELLMIKKVFNFSLAIQGAAIFGSLIDPLIKYLLGSFSNIGTVSIYEVARRFVTAITGLFNTTFRPILPKASALSSSEDYPRFIYEECANLSKTGVLYSGTVYGIGSLIIPIVIQQVFGFEEAILMYFILAIPESINNFGYSIYNFLIGIGRAYFLVLLQFINVVIIGLSVLSGLIIFKNFFGLLGYGLTIIIVNFMMILFVHKISGISIKKYFVLSKIYKLSLLVILLLISIISIYNTYLEIYYIIFILGSLSILLFITDLYNYFQIIFQHYFLKKNS